MEKRSARRLTLTVPPEQDGVKVDTLLRRTLGLSGTLMKKAKRLTDGILLDVRPGGTDPVGAGGRLTGCRGGYRPCARTAKHRV